LSKIFGSGSDSDTIEIFRSGSDYQISISAQHWELLCGQSKIRSSGMRQYREKRHFVSKTLSCVHSVTVECYGC